MATPDVPDVPEDDLVDDDEETEDESVDPDDETVPEPDAPLSTAPHPGMHPDRPPYPAARQALFRRR